MAVALGTALRELRVHLCQTCPLSKGAREWVEKAYVPLKKANPKFPILIRECSKIKPKVYARYGFGQEKSVDLTNKNAAEITKVIESLAKP